MKIYRPYIIQFVAAVAILLCALSCTKERILSDKELAIIFHDAFLSNAYSTQNRLKLDSLRLYEPIFQKYGYTTADVQHTISSFANRKSARLSDVVERSIEMLEQRGLELDFEVTILDTIDHVAIRYATRSIYQDSLITMRTMRDTSKFSLKLEELEIGEYEISFDYLVDSLDTTSGNYLSKSWIEKTDEESSKSKANNRTRAKNAVLSRRVVSHFKSSFSIDDSLQVAHFSLAAPSKVNGTPNMTIKRLKVQRIPSAVEARDSLFKSYVTARIFDDELLF